MSTDGVVEGNWRCPRGWLRGLVTLMSDPPLRRRATFIATSSVEVYKEKSGVLYKKSPKFLVGWQKRYFVLSDKKLYYYANEEAKHPQGTINFDLVTVLLLTDKTRGGLRLILCPLFSKRKFKLRAPTPTEHMEWMDVLSKHINASAGSHCMIPSIVGKEWWRRDRISVGQFEETAVTGDLLLFRSCHFGARVQRLFTGASYDHVAMVLRYADGKLGLLEATQGNGVSIVMWKDFVVNNWQLLYSRIVLRHLGTNRNGRFIHDIEEFIRNNRNKAYGLNPIKLLTRSSAPGEETTYFCSELIASVYMHIGLISRVKAACHYWPGDFSQRKSLPLLGTTFLGEELCLDFNLSI
jgi:hypothetical protein